MERINKILRDSEYLEHLSRIKLLEKDRKFCKHNMNHFLDVCRIAWILNLEQDLGLDKEVIYAAGLLHDIGKWQQYETGEDHAAVSEHLCGGILVRCGFHEKEIKMIKEAIRKHRKEVEGSDLSRIIYKADKLSRNCLFCKAIDECKNFKAGEVPELLY
jgi:uncharacterized protein